MLLRITLNTGTSNISIKRYGIEIRIKTAKLDIKRNLLTMIHVEILRFLCWKIMMATFKKHIPINQPKKTR
jgi:hypothetical protein